MEQPIKKKKKKKKERHKDVNYVHLCFFFSALHLHITSSLSTSVLSGAFHDFKSLVTLIVYVHLEQRRILL